MAPKIMTKEKETLDENGVIQVLPNEGPIDLSLRVKVECTKDAPYHKEGEITECSQVVADKMVANGWGKLVK